MFAGGNRNIRHRPQSYDGHIPIFLAENLRSAPPCPLPWRRARFLIAAKLGSHPRDESGLKKAQGRGRTPVDAMPLKTFFLEASKSPTTQPITRQLRARKT